MEDILKQIGANLAEQVTASVLENVRRELQKINKQNFVFCYSEEEAAEKMGVDPKTLYRKRKNGEIDYSRSPSGKPVYLPKHIIDFLIRNEVRGGKSAVSDSDVENYPQLKLAS